MDCIYCGQPVIEARVEIGLSYCMSKECVVKALVERQRNYRLVLMPKQGFTYVSSDSPDLLNGKSSGRQ
jgi:hypothetical protein